MEIIVKSPDSTLQTEDGYMDFRLFQNSDGTVYDGEKNEMEGSQTAPEESADGAVRDFKDMMKDMPQRHRQLAGRTMNSYRAK